MAKYMVLYNSDASASDLMAQASEAEMKASMDEWMQWKTETEKSVKVDFGMPLQGVSHITPEGAGTSSSAVSGYSILEGDKGDVEEAVKSHPHLKRPGASIEVLEFLPMPGM